MRVTKLYSSQYVTVNAKKYLVDWKSPSASKLQTAVKIFLYNYWKNQLVLEEFKIPGSRLRCDFLNLNKKIAIEVHGDQHFEFNKFFHNSRSNYQMALKRDMNKYNWLEENNFKIIELIEEDVKQLTVEYIKEKFGVFIL